MVITAWQSQLKFKSRKLNSYSPNPNAIDNLLGSEVEVEHLYDTTMVPYIIRYDPPYLWYDGILYGDLDRIPIDVQTHCPSCSGPTGTIEESESQYEHIDVEPHSMT